MAWGVQFISHLVTHKNGPEDSFEFRFAIDLLNLFTVSCFHFLISWLHYPCSGRAGVPGSGLQEEDCQEGGQQDI